MLHFRIGKPQSKRLESLIFTLVCCLCLLGTWSVADAATKNSRQEVRVGYIYDGDYMYKTAEGEYRGYDVEYLYTLAQQVGWHITFMDYIDSESSLKALQDNTVDILIGMAKTPEREATFFFSEKKMVTSYMTLMVRPEDERYIYGDTAAFNGMVAGGVYAFDKTRAVAQFSPSDSYFMLSPQREDLKKQLDEAMDQVLTQNPLYEMQLLNKYFARTQGDVPLFTPKEKAYVAGSPALKVAMLNNASPYSYVDNKGEMQGVVVEYYRNLAKLSGLKFTYTGYEDVRAAQAALADKKADVVAIYTQDIFQAVKQKLLLSVPYGNANLAMVSRSNASNKQHYVISQRDADIVATQGRNLQLPEAEVLPNSRACFQALRNGKADAVLCDMQVAMWFLNRERVSDYAVVSLPGTSGQIYSAVSITQPLLHDVLNKSILASNDLFDRLLVEQALQQDSGLVTFFNKIPRLWALITALISFVALVLVAAAAVIILRRRKTEAQLAIAAAETRRKEEAVKATEKANEVKFNFFANLSHDMRTPLNGIIGFTNLAGQSENLQQEKEFLQKINISGQLMLELVNDMLTISRLEHGKLILNPEPIMLFDLLEHIVVPVEVTAAQAGVTFVVDKNGVQDCPILADKLNVQKIFLNLLSNAMKFTESGKKVTLQVRTALVQEKTLLANISVQDEGTGISAEFLPHVFEAFAQETAQGIRGTKGTGLGLAIVKQLVELMGGSIAVSSKIGQGTTFSVQLPWAVTSRPAVSVIKNAEQASQQDIDACLQGKTVLVCEDNALNLEIVSRLLAVKKMQVVSAANGALGVEAFRRSKPYAFAAILMDNRMPVMGGLEAAGAIRALVREDAGNIPIIALTADVFPEDIKKFTAAGMNGFLSKPLKPDALYGSLAASIIHRSK